MSDNHGVSLLESDMQEIELIVKSKKKIPVSEIIARIIALPFVSGIFIIWAVIVSLYAIGNFVMYGGEMINYSKKTNRKTILDVYQKVSGNEK